MRSPRKALRGSGGTLPHAEQIQAAFGHHDVGHVQAYTGGAAIEASQAIGAEAYASGAKIAFASAPSLHTAAHEAAHVVQQQAGVSLSGGVGQAGDRYERHADAVADLVVRGESAESLLDSATPAGTAASRAAGSEVQMVRGVPRAATGAQAAPAAREQVETSAAAGGADLATLRQRYSSQNRLR